MKYARANTDWFDKLFTYNLMHEHSLSISSGSEKSRTYASIGFLGDNGWSIADKVNRYTVNFRNDFDVSSKIRTSVQVVGSLRQQDAPGSFTRQSDVVTGSFSRDFDINPFSYALNTSRAVRPYDDNGNLEYVQMNYAPFNIFNELENNKIELNVVDAKLQGEFNWSILKDLKFNFTGALRYVKSDQLHKITRIRTSPTPIEPPATRPSVRTTPICGTIRRISTPSRSSYCRWEVSTTRTTTACSTTTYATRSTTTRSGRCHMHELNALAGMQINTPTAASPPRRSPATSIRWAAWSTTIPTSTA